jgi:hypothetical protein
MRDLKDLLEPLGDRPMPDRWDSIQRRSVGPLPEPHRSRLGAGVVAGVVAVLAIAAIVWLSPLGETGRQPESSTSPQPNQFVSPQGWTVTAPPGWTTKAFSIGQPGGAMQGTVISSRPVGAPELNEFAIAVIASDAFPSDAVALIVGDVPGATGRSVQPVPLPLAYADFEQAASTGNATVGALSFEGPRQLFSATTQVGSDASDADVDALRATIASLAFGDEAGTLPSPSGAPGLPTQDAVVDGRFVSDVVLDDGAFSVQPAPVGTVPVVPKAEAEKILLASPEFQGTPDGVVGFGLVTSKVSQYGIPTYKADPAWIAFGWGGVANCPDITAPPSPALLPSSGYVAVALIEGAGGGAISYESKSDTCGSVTGPTVRPATYIESVPWTANGDVTGGTIQITYTLPACGTLAQYNAGGTGDVETLSVEAEVPDSPGLCPGASPITDVVQLSPPGGRTITTVRHGPTGVVRQAGF